MISTSPWEQLCHLFQNECVAYQHLMELLHEEWSVLRQLDYPQLVDVTHRKEVVLSRIRTIEEERVACIRALPQVTSQSELLEWVAQATVPEAARAKGVLTQLISIGKQVKVLSARNTRLINRGLQVVRDAMSVVHEGLGVKPLYGESGCLTYATGATSLNVEG